jgi:hypothetical protein
MDIEDTVLAPAEFADSGDGSVTSISFSSRTLELIDIITQLDLMWEKLGISQPKYKWQTLVYMLKGAWAVLESKDNPDIRAQAAHSMRELIEKMYYPLGQMSDDMQNPSSLPEGDKRRAHIWLLVEYFIGNGGQTSEQIIDAQTDAIWELRQYFLDISHHSSKGDPTDVEEIKRKIIEMENILFNLFRPQRIEELDELDALMAQGEPV